MGNAMIEVPNRLDNLKTLIESGQTPTKDTLNRIAALQAIDTVQAGRDFVQEACERNRTATEQFGKS